MKSMTGFAKGQTVINGKNVIVEIKTLNSKQMDAIVKLPSLYKEHELEIRAMLNRLERGKIEFVITEEQSSASSTRLDNETLQQRYEQAKAATVALGCEVDSQSLMKILLQQSDLWTAAEEQTLDDEEWGNLSKCISDTISEVDATRIHEGEILKEDFEKHVALIEQYLGEIPQYEGERIDTAKERIRNWLAESGVKDVDENRFEQELIYYLEKLDITEEKVRLAKHISYFREVMAKEESSGKKLGFIAQEMGREINTTGSKANHVEIQKLVVAMKDELEKIKEQLGNIL